MYLKSRLNMNMTDLWQFITFDDAEVKLVRASGSHWISHKVLTMKIILPKFGAYSSYLIALAKDKLCQSF